MLHKVQVGRHQILYTRIAQCQHQKHGQRESDDADQDRFQNQGHPERAGRGTQHFLRIDTFHAHRSLSQRKIHKVDGGDNDNQERDTQQQIYSGTVGGTGIIHA